MTVIDIDTRKTGTDVPKPRPDRVTREPAEHPDPAPQDSTQHPVTRGRPGAAPRRSPAPRREPVGAE